MQHVIATRDEDEEQEVAGEHICKETERERQRTNDKEGRDLNRSKENVDKLWNTWHKGDALEVLSKALLLDADVMEDHEGEESENIRESNMRHRWELHQWHKTKEVIGNNKDKEGEEEWHEAKEIVADNLFAKILTDKAVDGFTKELKLAWNNRRFT